MRWGGRNEEQFEARDFDFDGAWIRLGVILAGSAFFHRNADRGRAIHLVHDLDP